MMMVIAELPTSVSFLDLLALGCTGLVTYIGLFVKGQMSEIKNNILVAKGEILGQLTVTNIRLEKHLTEDQEKFDGIEKDIYRLEHKGSRRTGGMQ